MNVHSKNDFVKTYIRYKEQAKLATSYGDKFLENVDSDGRIRTSFKQILNTGRVASGKPNMQQIPADNDYRNCFVSGYDDSIIVDRTVDYKANIDVSTLSDYEVIKVNYDYNSKSALYVYGDRDVVLNGQAPVATANIDSTSSTASTTTGTYSSYSGTTTSTTTDTTVRTFTGKADSPELVRISSTTSTAQLNNKFWTTTTDISTGIREWMNVLYTYLFLGSQKTYLNNLLFAAVNFVFEEQDNIDWIIKTTYFDAIQKDLSLQQLSLIHI